MKKILSSFFFLLLLVSCSHKDEGNIILEKKDFYVETKLGSEFGGDVSLQKVGRVSSSQDISLSSNASGRISTLLVKTGDTVKIGQTLALLQDTGGNYTTNLDRARNGVERAQINYDSSKLQLDKQIFDTQTQIFQLQRSLSTAQKRAEQNVKQAKDSFANSQYETMDSASALQIEQLNNNIEKLELDFQTKKISDTQTLVGFIESLNKEFISLTFTMDDIIEFSDDILEVPGGNKNKIRNFDYLLGALDVLQKETTEQDLVKLMNYRGSQEFKNWQNKINSGNIAYSEMNSFIIYMKNGYESTRVLLSNLELTLNNSITSVGQLSQTDIQGFIGKIDGYQAGVQGSYAGFVAFSNSVNSFLISYEQSQNSFAKSIELQKKDREIKIQQLKSGQLSANVGLETTIIGNEDSIQGLETQISQAQNTLENTKMSYEVSLRSLLNVINESQISYSAAAKEYSKLTITSPINGTISKISADLGQEVSMGTPLFQIVSSGKPEVQIGLNQNEKSFIEVGKIVQVKINSSIIEGSIYAISDVADDNLNFPATIIFAPETSLIGNIVEVNIPVDIQKMLLPINIISTKGEDIGTVKTFSGGTLDEIRVRMGDVYGDYVEIISCAQECSAINIVTTDVSNFDSNKFNIIEK